MIICPLKSITEKQMTSNEFTLSAALLHFDRKALNAIRNGKVQVVHASAEQVLKEQFATLLTEDCPFHCSLSLIVVDRRISHCLYMVSILFEIFLSSVFAIPVLALTGTVDLEIGKKIHHLLSLTPGVHCITLSLERSNIKLTVMKVKREQNHSNFKWIADMIKRQGLATPKLLFSATQ